MSISNNNLLSGRSPVVAYDDLSADRYKFLALGQAEPSLGAGDANAVLTLGADNTRIFSNALALTSINVSGTATANLFVGNGAGLTNLIVSTANITFDNTTISTSIFDANIILAPTGNGVVVIANVDGGATGIQLGSNTSGQFVSNAVVLTTATSVTNGLAELNLVLGKLVPPQPPAFPGGTTLTLNSIASYRMANIVQTDNTANSRSVSAGTAVANVLRAATYSTNTIANRGPGDRGLVSAVRNGATVGSITLTGTSNGVYGGNLVISNNYDYNVANASIVPGFWTVFSAAVAGTAAPAGWNDLRITDTAANSTNITSWYYDNSAPGTPTFSANTMTPTGTPAVLYSSTIPHYTNTTQFEIGTTVAAVSGNTYPLANTLATGTAAGAFSAPATVTYNQSNIGSNTLNSFQTAAFTTTANVTTGFGGSATGPQLSVNNSYATGSLTLTTALANTVLYKSGTAVAIDETNIVVIAVGTGAGNAMRIENPGTGNTPAYTGSEAPFNSETSTLQTYDATVVGSGTQGLLLHNQNNYSVGFLPVGPDLTVGRSGTQYFTFKFVRTNVSKFNITYAGTVAGMWVALPDSAIDDSSGANGWIDMSVAYAGAGFPGVNAPGNGSDGCSLGGAVQLNTLVASTGKTCTFGTVSSSSTVTNEIYVRIALTAGQSVTGLSINTASN